MKDLSASISSLLGARETGRRAWTLLTETKNHPDAIATLT
jgi:hypothetical protein